MNSKKTILVFAHTEWCEPSKLMAPIISSLKKRNIEITHIDLDKEHESASKLNLKATPTLLAIKDGRVSGSLVGAHSLKDCLEFCNTFNE